jgi:nucleoside-diphosphate-sugar epimerase
VIQPGSGNGSDASHDTTVLVTGASGFLGAPLVRRLVAGGAQVRALVRSTTQASRLEAVGARAFVGDINDPEAVGAALKGVRVVYHLAGKLLVPGQPVSEYRRTHVDGTKLLLACCQERSDLNRFVHCSTTGVLGVTGERAADETSPFRPTNIYELTKAEAELAVQATWSDRFPAVIVRPGLVYGPGDLHLLGFFRTVLHRRFRPIGRRPVWLHPIFIDDMTEALIRCGEGPRAVGECFHIAAPEPASLVELAAAIARAGGTTLPPGRIPLAAARLLAAFGDLLPADLRRSAPLTRSRLEFLTHSRVYSVEKARQLLDFVACTDLPTGIARTVAWYRQHGHLPSGAAT